MSKKFNDRNTTPFGVYTPRIGSPVPKQADGYPDLDGLPKVETEDRSKRTETDAGSIIDDAFEAGY